MTDLPDLPLGSVASGAVATVGRSRGNVGRVDLGGVDPGGIGARWWVLGEDRWRRPEVEPSTRFGLVDDTPVAEVSTRVPGGDAVITTYGFVAPRGGTLVAHRVEADTKTPLAVALVVDGPDLRCDGKAVTSGEDVVALLPRAPSRWATASEVDALLEALQAEEDRPFDGTAAADGALALVWPLAHRATSGVVLVPTATPPGSLPDNSAGAGHPPPPETVAAGWRRQADRGARFEGWVPDGLALARCLLLLGTSASPSVGESAERVRALLRLGWLSEADEATRSLASRRDRRGGFGDPPNRVATEAALAAVEEWWSMGLPEDALTNLVIVASAAERWLRRDRSGSSPLTTPAGGAPVGDLLAAAPSEVVAAVDALLRIDGDEVVLGTGWTPALDRRPFEVHDVPTRWGRFSYAVRWHGQRPAILWQVEPWPDSQGADQPVLRAPALDPTWAGQGLRGEALLEPVPSW